MEKKNLLIPVLIGLIIGVIGTVKYRYLEYKDFYFNLIEIDAKDDVKENHDSNKSLNNKSTSFNNNVVVNDFLSENIKCKRSVFLFNDEGDVINESVSYYDITISCNENINLASFEIQILNSFPFCFSNDDISKPPIFVFPKFFNLDNWDSIISNEDVLKNKYVDNVVLIRNKPNYEVVKGDTNLEGKNEIIIKDNVFIIKSNSEGEVDVIYLVNDKKNNLTREICMNGMIARNYTLKIDKNNPYIINYLNYETFSDISTSILNIPTSRQIIREVITTIN